MREKIFAGLVGLGALIGASFGFQAVSTPDVPPADVNEDGAINLQDISIVLSNMSSTSGTSTSAE